jgi:hypothetical protein
MLDEIREASYFVFDIGALSHTVPMDNGILLGFILVCFYGQIVMVLCIIPVLNVSRGVRKRRRNH